MRWLLLLLLAPSLASAACTPKPDTCPTGQGCIQVAAGWDCRALCNQTEPTRDAIDAAMASSAAENPAAWGNAEAFDRMMRSVEQRLGCSLRARDVQRARP